MEAPLWKNMTDEELWEYTRGVAEADAQSSQWEGIPLDKDDLHQKTFNTYKGLRDGK